MRMQRNFYEVLGVPRSASKKDIKEKYYTLARKYHPDRANDKQLADKLFVQINRAYSTLYNDAKREKYDAGLDAVDSVPARPSSSMSPRQAAPAPSKPEPISAQQIRDWFDQASRLQLRGEFTEAISICSKTLEADPFHFPGLLLMGDLLAQTGKQAEALQVYERAFKLQPSNRLLSEKMARLHTVIARRAGNSSPSVNGSSAQSSPGQRPPVDGIRPPLAAQKAAPIVQNAPPAPAKAEPKSLLDRLIKRK